jgi:hypothetical protein
VFPSERDDRALADHAGTRSGSRAIAQTLGWAIATAIQARLIKPDPISVAEIPIKDATGPASADPSGISTKEPSASYELTRDLAVSGTCCWKTVNQSAR